MVPVTPTSDGGEGAAGRTRTKTSSTPGRGMPWSPRSVMNSGSDLKSRAARAGGGEGEEERSGERRGRDRAVHRRRGAHALVADDGRRGGAYEDMSGVHGGGGRGKAVTGTETSAVARENGVMNGNRGGQNSLGALVSYLRCCVASGDATTESEMELAELRREEMNASSGAAACVPSSCVPCATQPRRVFRAVRVARGRPAHRRGGFKCDPAQWRSHASPDAMAEPRTYKPCLVLDLDETLVHSSFKPVPNSDFIVPVEIDGKMTDVYMLKRPWVDFFLEEVSKDWEIVVFTASLPKYANRWWIYSTSGRRCGGVSSRHCLAFRVTREDLTCLGRDLAQTVIVDNSPYSYAFHPQNAFPISSFVDNPNDDELLNALSYLRQLARVRRDAIRRTRGCLPSIILFARRRRRSDARPLRQSCSLARRNDGRVDA